VQALENGTPWATLPPTFLGSTEMYRRLLDEFYTKFLGRGVDPSGEQVYLEQLRDGRSTLGQVAVSILASQEYYTRTQR
jgi:hypothetical protein